MSRGCGALSAYQDLITTVVKRGYRFNASRVG